MRKGRRAVKQGDPRPSKMRATSLMRGGERYTVGPNRAGDFVLAHYATMALRLHVLAPKSIAQSLFHDDQVGNHPNNDQRADARRGSAKS